MTTSTPTTPKNIKKDDQDYNAQPAQTDLTDEKDKL